MSKVLPDYTSPDNHFLSGSSDMARLILAKDWSATPLGPIDRCPQSLRTTVSLCLASNFPINIIWGPEHTQIYNDGYRTLCGDKHPDALGMDYRECWSSAWSALDEPFHRALGGDTSFLENQRMFLFRNGYLEETFFTFSLSPIRDESGSIGGVFHPVTETTRTMLGERRTRAVRDVTARLAEANSTHDVFEFAVHTLARYEFDLPFVALYRRAGEDSTYQLAGCTGATAGSVLIPAALEADAMHPWPIAGLQGQEGQVEVTSLRALAGDERCGPYEEAPDTGFAIPIGGLGSGGMQALLLAGASARLPLDDTYRGFIVLLGAALRAALVRVAAAEAERERAAALAAIDNAKTVFFSNVSHEFRTPLTLMLGPLEEALHAPETPPAQREQLSLANRNGQRLLKLVNSLLTFSRIEAGRAQAMYVPTALAAFTNDLASNFESACAAAGLALHIDCPPLPEPVWVDQDMWEKIVMNLVSNAFKFTFQGSIALTLRQIAGQVELIVADTGVGIPSPELANVFERFHRVEGQRGRSVEGTGIGLSLVRELVRLHGGKVLVASTEGQGTAFTVQIPLGSAHLPPEQVHDRAPQREHEALHNAFVAEAERWLPDVGTPEDAAAESATQAGPVGHVLLADDNADMRGYVRRILTEGGYKITAVDNGASALAAVRAGPLPDLVLSDVMMPELDGFGLLTALRADESTRGLVVMLLSARAGEEARVEGLAAGADDYMVKPFSARELRARVDGAIRLARQRRESAEREQTLRHEVDTERARTALRLSEAHAASLFEQTSAGIVETDMQGKLLRVNDRYCEMLGRTRADLLGRDIGTLIHPHDLEQNQALLASMRETGQSFDLENRYRRPDGSAFWVHKTVSRVQLDGEASAQRILAVVIDIEDRKKAEEEVREASRRKDEFLAMLAHELRNPLAPISAAAELMSLVPLDAGRLRQTSQVISRQVRHMTSLVDDLLDVSRVTRGLVDIQRTPQDMHVVAANAIEQVRPLIEARSHRLVLDLAMAPALVLGDQKRLVQIFGNLLNNAAKYTPDGGIITLRTEIDANTITLRVQDNGIGITPEVQQRVFDLFAQAERTPDRAQGGLGLGLSLVKSLAELHGGTVQCYSDGPAKGSCFTVILPRLQVVPAAPELDVTVPEVVASSSGALQVLVVDDNTDAADMLCLLLEANGYVVRVEHHPRSAFEQALRHPPDVAILDIGLPDIDGNELARMLRARLETRGCMLVAVTGYSQEHDRKAALEAGFDHHMVKPANGEQLVGLLKQIAETARQPS